LVTNQFISISEVFKIGQYFLSTPFAQHTMYRMLNTPAISIV